MPGSQYSETDVRSRNCAFIREKLALINDLTIGMYADIAQHHRKKQAFPPSPDEIAQLYEEIHGMDGGTMVTPDFARFCCAFSEEYGGSLVDLPEQESESGIPRIAYLQNTFSDRAYRQFSSHFERVSAAYFPGFREVCEEVYNGGCSYAILPISNSNDGQLISFRRLISKYDLNIVSVADIQMNDDDVMRFALLKKGLDYHFAQAMRYLDLSVVLDNFEYGLFISACESLGAVALTMNSLPLEYSDDRFGLLLQFDIANANLDALFAFLEGSRIRYYTVGIYDIINYK